MCQSAELTWILIQSYVAIVVRIVKKLSQIKKLVKSQSGHAEIFSIPKTTKLIRKFLPSIFGSK